MANSKLLKEAIADAKAVRETAIANAKIALEEAFTPRLQSILSKKLQAEMEGDDEEIEEELDSSDIGDGTEETPVEPSANAADAHTELGSETDEESDEVGEEDENVDVVSEEEDHEEEVHEEEEDEVHEEDEFEVEDEIEDEDELDLEAIIRELEGELDGEESEYEETYEGEEEEYEEGTYEGEGHEDEEIEEADGSIEDPTNADDASIDEEEHEDDVSEEEEETIDLEEILREMGYGDEDEEVSEEEEGEDHSELEAELGEAYSTIKELQSTINEVNLLNAKLLYANKLFRGYSLTNEQKSKVVENLDRTTSVREVKLVYATLAESMNFTGTEKKSKRAISESVSKATKSTAPVKEVITESADALAERFKKLANIK
jgi:hypothetical protein